MVVGGGVGEGSGPRWEVRVKRLDGALDEGSEKEAGIGAALDGKLEQGCRLVGAGVDGEENFEGELEPRGSFHR